MVGASKILTVSYGTFSCTLEGFDEPFNTMKAIAEYFRDLAADDRYFGAEPPTPDAAMLHQIAEREMKRRVEAKVQDNGVILRATDSLAAPLTNPVAKPASPTTATPAHSMFEDQHAADQAAPAISDSVAEKLARIRNAMASSRASGETTRPPVNLKAALAAAEAEEMTKAAEEHAKAEAEAARVAEEHAKAEAEAARAAEEQAKAEAETARVAEEQAKAEAEAEAKAAEEEALLAALVGKFDDENTPQDGRFDDDEMDADITTLTPEGDDSLMASLAAAMAEPDTAAELPAASGEALLDIDSDLPDASEIESDDDLDDDLADVAGLAELDEEDEAALEAALNAKKAPKAEPMPETESTAMSVPMSFGDDFAKEVAPPETASADAPSTAPKAEEETPAVKPEVQRARARVIKIRRAPVNPAAAAAARAQKDASDLSPEAEADLMRELDSLQDTPAKPQTAPGADSVAEDSNESNVQAQTVMPVRPERPASSRRRGNELSATEDDASVKRLLDQTNSELEGPENRRRLSAIAHLKAAVAATVADRKSGGDTGPTDEMRMNPYRNDLERAVRPRSAPETATPASAAERPAPLMLVSEQRIDTPRTKPTTAPSHITPVRPRRVSAGNLAMTPMDDDDAAFDAATDGTDASNIFGATTSFAEYAERLGAESLPELLEAAAAYAANIEGRSDITRPQMLEHVMKVQPGLQDDRESMLRSFGTLLREGRIEKVRRGHFVLAETSPIHAEARKAAEG